MESHDEDATNVSLLSLKDAENNDTQDGSFHGSTAKRQENDEEKFGKLTKNQMKNMLRGKERDQFSDGQYESLYKLTYGYGNVRRMQELMRKICPTDHDKVYALVCEGQPNSCLQRIIVNSMYHDPEMLTYLITVYESVKASMEKMQPTEDWSQDYPPLILYPFLINSVVHGGNLLHYIPGERSVEIIKRLSKCSSFDKLINMPNADGSSPLINAIKSEHIPLAVEMVELGSYVDSLNKNGESPIFLAVKSGKVELVEKIFASGRQETQEDMVTSEKIYGEKHKMFYPAILGGNEDMVTYLRSTPHMESPMKLLVEELENDDGVLKKSIAQHDMIRLLKLWVSLKDNPPKVESIAYILMRAVDYENKDIIIAILDTDYGEECLKSADPVEKKTVLHYGVKSSEIMKLLLEEMEKIFDKPNDLYKLISQEDTNGCLAIHHAAVAGNSESLKMLAQWSARSNEDSNRTACDYIVSFANCQSDPSCSWEVSVKVIKDAIESLRKGDPASVRFNRQICLSQVAEGGQTDLIRYLLDIKVPICTNCFPNHRNPLQAAVTGGSLETVQLILDRLPEFLNAKCTLGSTPGELAAGENRTDILETLFNYGMKPLDESIGVNLLDKWYEDEKMYITLIDKIVECDERSGLTKALRLAETNVMVLWVIYHPNVVVHVLDLYESHLRYFYTFEPLEGKDDYVEVITYMTITTPEKYLTHGVVDAFLDAQLNSPAGNIWYFFNMFVFFTFLVLFSTYIGLHAQGTVSLKSPTMIILTVFILLLCSMNIIKELLQMVNNIAQYLFSFNNVLEWTLYICTFIFLLPVNETKSKSQMEAGAIAIFLAWINFIWFLKRFQIFGIYVVLTKKVFLSLLKLLPMVVLFVFAFAMTFLLLRNEDYAFSTLPWSALTTLIMMGGEIDYRDAFLSSQSSVYIIQCFFLVLFFLIMGIVVMNVFVGLAVGDTGEMMSRSNVENQKMKATLWIEFQRTLSRFPERWRPQPVRQLRRRFVELSITLKKFQYGLS